MSVAEEKSEDKKEIEDEERQQILSEQPQAQAQAQAQAGEVQKMKKALEEAEQERDARKKAPIGGIKMPGFLKSKSRDRCKEGEQDVEEGKDLLRDSDTPAVITTQDKEHSGEDKPARRPLLATIMINNPFGRKNKDTEQGQGVGAGLASMETLEDSSGVDKAADQVDDGMESVKLDADDKDMEKAEDVDNAQKPFWPIRFDTHNKFHMMICAAVVFFLLLVVVIAVAASRPPQQSWLAPFYDGPLVEVSTNCGPLQGKAEGGVYVFRAIPYAVPPLAERRFRPAQPLDNINYCWNGTRAVHNSTPCLQPSDNGTLTGSEDCLTLDVFTPRLGYENPMPVVVVVAAETLSRSYSPEATPAPALVRARDVVVVHINFRLGVLGFLAAKALSNSVHPPTSGNYGLSDLLVALQWLQLNVQAFNGNNNSVTVLGHGAGATLVTALSVQKRARQLFARAWVSGGSGVLPQEEEGPTEAYEQYIQSLPCGQEQSLGCLQHLESTTLLEMVPPGWMEPFTRLGKVQHSWLTVDNVYLRNGFQEAWQSTEDLPVVVGAVMPTDVPSSEGHSPEQWDANDGQLVRERLVSSPLVKWLDEALRRYSATWSGYVSLLSDLRTVCPLATLALHRPGTAFYVANHTHGPADARSDLDAILGRPGHGQGQRDERFAGAVQEAFYRFAKNSPDILTTFRGGIRAGEPHLERHKGYKAVIFVDEHTTLLSDYPHCSYWAAKDVIGKFARRD